MVRRQAADGEEPSPSIPAHEIYVEVFGGGAALFFAKEPSPIEVYNDLDSGLVTFFRVLRDRDKFAHFFVRCCATPYSREDYKAFLDTWQEPDDDCERAYRWFVVARSSFAGIWGNSWGSTVTKSARGMAGTASRWQGILELLPALHLRAMRLQVENADFRSILERYDTESTFFYLDPPYVPATRKSGEYRHELAIEDHEDLVSRLLDLKGKALLSAGWQKRQFETICSAAGRTRNSGLQGEGNCREKQMRTETVWISPRCETITEHE